MGVFCFASLKGGVGKTTLSLNIAAAFAQRGCQSLLIDLDPTGHASRFFLPASARQQARQESPLARLFLAGDGATTRKPSPPAESMGGGSLVDAAIRSRLPLVIPVRPQFAVLPSGPELRHFLWGKGAQAFSKLFPELIAELRSSYDYIFIDTPPDYNVLTRNAIAASDQVVVPVDASAMSIHCLEEIIFHSSHIKGPVWSIMRTMVNRQASRIQQLSTSRLHENLSLAVPEQQDAQDEAPRGGRNGNGLCFEPNLESADEFISLLEQRETPGRFASAAVDNSPIFLLNTVVYRAELQNKLSFLGQTAFDGRASQKLASQYNAVARELEELLSVCEGDDPGGDDYDSSCLSSALGLGGMPAAPAL